MAASGSRESFTARRCGNVAAVLIVLASPCAAPAQDQASTPVGRSQALPANGNVSDEMPSTAHLAGRDEDILRKILKFDSSSLAARAPIKKLKLPKLSDPQLFAVTRSEQPNGAKTISLKRTLDSEWNANIGADLGIGPTPGAPHQFDRSELDTKDGNSGAAWASLGVGNFATIDAQIDPTQDQGRLSTTLRRSVPVGRDVNVTLQGTYSFADNLGAVGAAGISTQSQTGANARALQVFGNQNQLKFDILPTGTSLAATVNSSSDDPLTHRNLTADQKLLGPLHVTAAVSEVGEPTADKSVTAGFKLNW